MSANRNTERRNSARSAPLSVPLLTSGISADLAGEERLRAPGSNATKVREQRALHMFERRLKEMSDASVRMIDAIVELRDARAVVQTP